MSERTQIGPAVDADLWRRFRQDVQSRKGQIRGVLGDELENAIRQYISEEARPVEQRIDDRLSRIEDSLGVASADGGTDTSQPESHTHAPSSKPAPNAATEKKVQYLAGCVIDSEVPNTRDLQQVPRDTLRDIVVDEYGFRSDTARRYVGELVDYFGLVEHPMVGDLLVTEAERDRIHAQQREDAADETSEQLDAITDNPDK